MAVSSCSPRSVSGQREARDVTPAFTADARALFFGSTRGSGDDHAIWTFPFLDDGSAGEPLKVPGPIDTSTDELAPVPSADGLALYFRRAVGAKNEIFLARRDKTASPFDEGLAVIELNTADDQAPSWLSPDQCRLYFHSAGSGARKTDLFVAYRGPPR